MSGEAERRVIDTPSLGVYGCARCGRDHAAITLAWRALRRPIGRCNFWAPCPITGDPILLMLSHDDPVLPCP